MPSASSVEEIEVSDVLKKLGVTRFYKQDTFLVIEFGENRRLLFDIDKSSVQKTLQNLQRAADEISFGTNILGDLKAELTTARHASRLKLSEQKEEDKLKPNAEDSGIKKVNVFKYSTDIPLAEQIKLGEDYVFLQIIDDKPITSPTIDLSKSQNIILSPRGKTPIHDFEYQNEDEIKQIIAVAKTKTIDELYYQSKSLWQKFVKATEEQIVLLTADSIFTFFQDVFVTTHYTMLVARVGSGKGAILITFTYLGYRVILAGNMSGASILDLLGWLESGQVVIAEDELNHLKSDSDKWNLYTIGYDAFGETTRTLDGGTSKRAIYYYPAFGYKIFGAETSLDTSGLEGLIDRTFQTKLLKGKPKFYVKNLRKRNLSLEYQTLLSEIINFRKLMLIYRLLHANDLFGEVQTNIDGRALELTGPIIDLFYALSKDKTLLKEEILPVLSSFLQQKGVISQTSLDNIIFSVVRELSINKEYYIEGNEQHFKVPHSVLYEKVRDASDGDNVSTESFVSPLFEGEIKQKRISGHCKDKLHATDTWIKKDNKSKRGLLFNKETIVSLADSFNDVTEIKLLDDNDDRSTQSRKNASSNDKGEILIKSEQASPVVELNNLQKSTKDSENISDSNQSDTIEDVKNDNDFYEKTSLYRGKSRICVTVLPSTYTGDINVSQLLGTYVAFDFEWDANADNRIEAVSFVDSNGNSEVKLRERDFNGLEVDLLKYINEKLFSYQWSIGWNTQGNPTDAGNIRICDLSILHQRCQANSIPSLVELRNKGVPYLGYDGRLKHIDLCNVYRKAMVKDGMYNSYRTNKLDDVSKALLGYGKYKNHSGKDFQSLPIDEAIEYSLRDSQLVMDLSKYNDFEVLDAMLAISEITQLDFEKVCRTNLSTWWSAIFDTMVRNGECPVQPTRLEFNGTYKGAEVLAPKKGLYNNNIVVVDAKSLYPSVGINYNLSFDTINCDCCKDNPDAKLSKIIPDKFTKDCKFVNPITDWICKRNDGAFPTKLKVFRAERLRQKALGNKAKQHALKILINGGYGVFGSGDYSYYDPRVAELVTAAGRYILSEMQSTANHVYGFDIIYGDTDSLFLNNTSSKTLSEFQEQFNREYDIELEIKNRYDKLLLSSNKKHYIGYEKGVIDSVGFEGIKSDRCEFFHQVYDQLINDIIKQETDPLPKLRKSISDLDSNKVNPDLLKISKLLNQNPEDYKSQSCQAAKVGKAQGKKQGELIEYFSSNKKKIGQSWTLNSSEIDIPHYKELLWNIIDEILEIAGYPVADLAKEFGIKPKKKRSKNNSIGSLKRNNAGGGL